MLLVIVLAVLIVMVVVSVYKTNDNSNQHKQSEKSQRELTYAERELMRQADDVWDNKTYLAVLTGNYTGPLPEYDLGSWTDMYPNIYRTKIAGINFHKDAKAYASQYVDVMLYPDLKNEYDSNAIKIVTTDYVLLGYVPADETKSVREWVRNNLPHKCRARVDEKTEFDELTGDMRTYLIGNICITKCK